MLRRHSGPRSTIGSARKQSYIPVPRARRGFAWYAGICVQDMRTISRRVARLCLKKRWSVGKRVQRFESRNNLFSCFLFKIAKRFVWPLVLFLFFVLTNLFIRAWARGNHGCPHHKLAIYTNQGNVVWFLKYKRRARVTKRHQCQGWRLWTRTMKRSTPIINEVPVEVDTPETRKSRHVRHDAQRRSCGTPHHKPGSWKRSSLFDWRYSS